MSNHILKIAIKNRVGRIVYAEKSLFKLIKEKFKIKIPSKDKAVKYIKENIKSVKEVQEAYKNMPQILNFFKKSYVTADTKVIPPGFMKNMILLVAIVSIFQGTFPAKSDAINEIKKIITVGFEPLGYASSGQINDIIGSSKSMTLAQSRILRALRERVIKLERGTRIPDGLKNNELIFSEKPHGGKNYYTLDALKNAKGFIYLSIDTSDSTDNIN